MSLSHNIVHPLLHPLRVKFISVHSSYTGAEEYERLIHASDLREEDPREDPVMWEAFLQRNHM